MNLKITLPFIILLFLAACNSGSDDSGILAGRSVGYIDIQNLGQDDVFDEIKITGDFRTYQSIQSTDMGYLDTKYLDYDRTGTQCWFRQRWDSTAFSGPFIDEEFESLEVTGGISVQNSMGDEFANFEADDRAEIDRTTLERTNASGGYSVNFKFDDVPEYRLSVEKMEPIRLFNGTDFPVDIDDKIEFAWTPEADQNPVRRVYINMGSSIAAPFITCWTDDTGSFELDLTVSQRLFLSSNGNTGGVFRDVYVYRITNAVYSQGDSIVVVNQSVQDRIL